MTCCQFFLNKASKGTEFWSHLVNEPISPSQIHARCNFNKNWFKTNYCLVITYDALLGRVTKPTWSTSNRRLFPNLKKGYFQMKQTFISKCEILWYFDTIRPSFLSFKTNICKPSSWCQRYFQAGGTAHPTGGWILPEFCSHPHCPVFLTFALTPGCLLSSSQCSSNPHISAIKTPQHSGLMLWKKRNIFFNRKVKPLNKTPDCFVARRGSSLDF